MLPATAAQAPQLSDRNLYVRGLAYAWTQAEVSPCPVLRGAVWVVGVSVGCYGGTCAKPTPSILESSCPPNPAQNLSFRHYVLSSDWVPLTVQGQCPQDPESCLGSTGQEWQYHEGPSVWLVTHLHRHTPFMCHCVCLFVARFCMPRARSHCCVLPHGGSLSPMLLAASALRPLPRAPFQCCCSVAFRDCLLPGFCLPGKLLHAEAAGVLGPQHLACHARRHPSPPRLFPHPGSAVLWSLWRTGILRHSQG